MASQDTLTLRGALYAWAIRSEVWIPDVQALVDAATPSEAKRLSFTKPTLGKEWFAEYHKPTEVNAWLRQLVDQYSDIATLVEIGQSHEGRSILGIEIHSESKTGAPKKLQVHNGGIHAVRFVCFFLELAGSHHLL